MKIVTSNYAPSSCLENRQNRRRRYVSYLRSHFTDADRKRPKAFPERPEPRSKTQVPCLTQIAFTLIPRSASSKATDLVKPTTRISRPKTHANRNYRPDCHTRDVDDCSANLHKRDCILDPQERAAEQQPDRSIESFYQRLANRKTRSTHTQSSLLNALINTD